MIEIDFRPITEFFSRHGKVMLQFSAGKDSAACLWMLKPWWDKLEVVWCNQGNPYPETLEYMEEIAELVPNFRVIYGRQKEWIRANGYPVDVLPLESTELGNIIAKETGPRLFPFWSCCAANSWEPMADYIKEGKFTGVIRGQKEFDPLSCQQRSGSIFDSVEYLFPIEHWTDEQVYSYLGTKVPASYKRGLKSSLDCINCTAFMKEHAGRLQDLETVDLSAHLEVTTVHKYLREKLVNHLNALEACNG